MQLQSDPRVRRRLPCTLDTHKGHRQGLVLNLSRSGLFVQTNLPPRPGTQVAIDMTGPDSQERIQLRGQVVWRRRVNSRMTGTAQSGMGLRLDGVGPRYEALLRKIDPSLLEATAQATPPTDAARGFAVRVALRGSNRSRVLHLEAPDTDTASRQALATAGDGWTIVELKER